MFETHPLFPFTEDDRKYIRQELGLKESTIQEDVDAILDWFYKQPHLVDAGIDRGTVEHLLINAKGSIEKTKHRIDNFYKYRAQAPELIQNRDKYLNSTNDLWDIYVQVSMPKLFNGNRVSVIKFIDSDPSKFSTETLFRNTFMLADIKIKYDYSLNDVWVMDMTGSTFSHIMRLNPIILQKTANIFHEGLGARVKGIHILNATNFLQHLVSFMRQFFSPKIMDRIVIHNSLEDLHEHVPKKYLPKDFGGDEPYLSEFKDKYEKELRSSRTKKILMECSKMISNESKRPNSEKNEEYLVGSFRKLDFD